MKNKLKKAISENISLLDIIFILIISICFTLSDDLINDRHLSFSLNLLSKYIGFVLLFIVITFIFRLILSKMSKSNNNKIIDKIMGNKKRLFIIAIIIFTCWLPVLVMLYPGTCINDTWGQLASVINLKNGQWNMSAHHPMFDTIFMSTIILPIVYKFGHWHFAIFVYVLIQAIVTSLVFSYSLIYAKEKLKLSNTVIAIFLLIYIFCPIYATSVQTVSKDALSAWIYVLFMIQYIEIIRTKGNYLQNTKNAIIHIITIIFCILTKKIESYVILFSYIPLLIVYVKKLKYLLIPFLTTIFISFIFLPTINLTFNISKSGKQEMYSLPFQMTARYVKYNDKKITKEEKKAIDKVLNYNELSTLYHPTESDPIKKYSQKGKDSDYINYLKIWFKQGLKDPKVYLKAIGCQIAGWFSTVEYKPLINMNHHSQINNYTIPESVAIRNNISNKTYTIYNNIYDFIYKIPLFKIFLSYGFYSTFLPMFIILTLLKNKKYNLLLCCIPLILSIIIGLYLAPVSINLEGLRYLYPITYSLPILLLLTTYSYKKA